MTLPKQSKPLLMRFILTTSLCKYIALSNVYAIIVYSPLAQVLPAYVQQPPLSVGSIGETACRRESSAGGGDMLRCSKNDADEHTQGAFVKIIFNIPKGRGTYLKAVLSREGTQGNGADITSATSKTGQPT